MKDDLRQAFRALRRRPGFAAVAVLTLAFGIGINASLFSMISAFFLQPLPVKDAHQLVFLMQKGELINVPIGHSFPDYLDYRRATTVFSHLVAYMPTPCISQPPAKRRSGRGSRSFPRTTSPWPTSGRRSGTCSIPGRASRRVRNPRSFSATATGSAASEVIPGSWAG